MSSVIVNIVININQSAIAQESMEISQEKLLKFIRVVRLSKLNARLTQSFWHLFLE